MEIQVFSDIHLEFYKKTFPKITPKSKYLFLAGDIGKISDNNYKDFIKYCSNNWEKTYVVLGNHEYYHSHKTYDRLFSEYKKLIENFNNIYLLEKNIIKLEKWHIMGCTLWSHIHKSQHNAVNCPHKINKHIINDSNQVRTVPIGYYTYNSWHEESKEWIYDNIKNKEYENIIIFTHYPITHKNVLQKRFLNEKHNKERMNVFASKFDLSFDDIERKNIISISGHTHYSHNFKDNNIHFISNQMGYKDELIKSYSNFNDNGVFIIE